MSDRQNLRRGRGSREEEPSETRGTDEHEADQDRTRRDTDPAKGPPYNVGYAKPPNAHQFKPGRSGNPKGRPRGTRNFANDLMTMLKVPVKVSRDGKAKKISTQEAMFDAPARKGADR